MQGRIDTAAINAALFNIGDQEVFELDVNLNISPNYGGTTVPVEFTAGEYELKFLDTNPDRTAWIFGPYAGAEYWVRNMRIRKTEYDNNDLLFNGTASYGVGDLQPQHMQMPRQIRL